MEIKTYGTRLLAEKWFESCREFATNVDASSEAWLETVRILKQLGCTQVWVTCSYEQKENEEPYCDTMLIELPKDISPKLLAYIVYLTPDTIELKENGTLIELWWD